jgi:hypothetical protein
MSFLGVSFTSLEITALVLIVFVVFSDLLEIFGVNMVRHEDEVFEVESISLLILYHLISLFYF